MRNIPIYEDYRLFESAGPLASSFKRVGFKEMTRTDFEGFGGVQEGGLIYDGGENFIVLYGLATDDSKPVVCVMFAFHNTVAQVMYGNDPYDQVEAHILNQAEQKAFISKLSSFTKEMDRLCALPAGTEKTDGIKAWLRRFGFQVISGALVESQTDMPDDLRLSAVLDDLTIVMKALESKDYKSSGMKRFVDKMQNKLSDVYNEIERFEDSK